MIRYSSYGSSNYRAPAKQFPYRDPLEAEYFQLIELRERVRKAEAAASKRLTVATKKKNSPQ
ncbi:hypothetical protein ABIC03_001966 [Bradyrhizobium sp. RT6a]